MSDLVLVPVQPGDEQIIAEYRAEFPADRMQVTLDPERIPGLDLLEEYDSIADWLRFCESMQDKITWYRSVRESDGKTIGFLILRHDLAFDDDDPDFCSHIGYSIRPSERRKGYAKEQLRLGLEKAREIGLTKVRIICRDVNIGSNKTILANGGVFVDTLHGEESGMNVNRYDILL